MENNLILCEGRTYCWIEKQKRNPLKSTLIVAGMASIIAIICYIIDLFKGYSLYETLCNNSPWIFIIFGIIIIGIFISKIIIDKYGETNSFIYELSDKEIKRFEIPNITNNPIEIETDIDPILAAAKTRAQLYPWTEFTMPFDKLRTIIFDRSNYKITLKAKSKLRLDIISVENYNELSDYLINLNLGVNVINR